MGSGYQAEQTRIRHQRATPLRIEALLIEIRDLLRGLTEREDRESRMGRWLREPWDDAPATPAEKNTEVASLREQVAGLREALLRFTDWQDLSTTAYEARYGRDLGGGFANYYEAAMIHAHIALAAIPAPTPPEE